MNLRIGHGYDVHKLTEDRPLILGGIHIPFDKGLHGHSDADVLTHAIIDALLGAAGLGDIGQHFPDNNAKYAGICSQELLKNVQQKLTANAFQIVNIDATIVVQAPRLAPYILQMAKSVANTLDISQQQINIKAKTEEGLGFTGIGLGIAAHAVCLLQHI